MITIHHEKETDFNKNGYGAIDNYVVNAEVSWELNGQFAVSLEYPAFLPKADYLINKNILRIPVPFMQDQLFRIYRTRKVLGFVQVEARHIFYDLLDNLIEDTNIVAKNGQQALQQLLGATQYQHRFIGLSDITLTNTARMVRMNPVAAILDDSTANTFVSRWGGEVVRDNFTVRMAKQMGTDRGVNIQHKKDLKGYEATIDESTVVTRIMPMGFDGLRLPELYIDSPLVDLDNPKIQVIKYDDVKAAIGEYADDEDAIPLEEAYQLLRKRANEEYSINHLDEPETVVSVNFVTLHNTKEYEEFAQLQEIHQGDVVKVSIPEEGFEITSRLVAFTSDPLQDNHYTSTTLGNHVFEFTSSSTDTTRMRNEIESLKDTVITVMQAANGKNRNFWGTEDPNTLHLDPNLGDNYTRIVGEEKTLYQYVEINGERYWAEITSTADLDRISREVNEAILEIADVKTNINDRLLLVNQAIANNFTSLSTSIENVNNIATQAQLDAIGALGIVNNVNVTVNQLNGEIDTLITRVDGNDVLINQVKSTADGTVQTVADHAGRLTIVETNVNGLQTTVANKADQSQITQLSNTITSTVKNAVDTLEANGRNYFHKGLVMTNFLGNTNFVKFGDTTPQGFTVTGARDGRGYIRINNVITGNGLWTVTFDLGTPQFAAVGITVDVCDQGAKRFITRDDNKQERVSLTVNVTNHSSVYNFVDFGPMDWANFTINNIKIEKGGKSTPYVLAIEDTASSSQITQLSNQINLRVAKGDVMSQINIEAGRTLISSNKLYLDADTVTFSGSAFIPSAAISSLSADKVTTGTLNAANVNLINVNVSSLVGNTSNFIQSAWNGINSNLTVTGNNLVYTHADGSQTVMNSSGLYHNEGGTNYSTHYLMEVGTAVVGTSNMATTEGVLVTLPSIFRGKPFKVVISIADILSHELAAYGDIAIQRIVAFPAQGSINHANGTFRIYGYARVMNIKTNKIDHVSVQVQYTVIV